MTLWDEDALQIQHVSRLANCRAVQTTFGQAYEWKPSSKKIFSYLYVGNVATQGSGCHRGGSRHLFTTVCLTYILENSTQRDGDEEGTQSRKSLLSALRPVQNCRLRRQSASAPRRERSSGTLGNTSQAIAIGCIRQEHTHIATRTSRGLSRTLG